LLQCVGPSLSTQREQNSQPEFAGHTGGVLTGNRGIAHFVQPSCRAMRRPKLPLPAWMGMPRERKLISNQWSDSKGLCNTSVFSAQSVCVSAMSAA
ncbi:MAG: hypothetical protein WBZ08_03335, partial [Pseudolabrys sp.]